MKKCTGRNAGELTCKKTATSLQEGQSCPSMVEDQTRGIFHEYYDLVGRKDLFEQKLAAFCSGTASCAEGVNLCSLFVLFDVVLDMMAEAGLKQLLDVYGAVKRHSSAHFERCMLWRTCHLSGITARSCLTLSDGVYVHPQHEKFVMCLWLCMHMREQERNRDKVPTEHAEIYRAATQFVLEQLDGVYEHMADSFKKNKVFACTSSVKRA